MDPNSEGIEDKEVCKYGMACYRRNPSHFEEFRHPAGLKRSASSSDGSSMRGSSAVVDPGEPTRKASKVDKSEVSGLFLTKVSGLSEKCNLSSYGIRDILSWDADDMESSVQFNFMIDPGWLLSQYPVKNRQKPLILITGASNGTDSRSLQAGWDKKIFPNVKIFGAPLSIPYGTHHTKMMLLKYRTGIRIVIHTSNLTSGDWDKKTQGMYVSPLCAKISDEGMTGESETRFKADLMDYISAYRIGALNEWVEILKSHDLSGINVFLVGSVPGRHVGAEKEKWGHLRMRNILNTRSLLVDVDISWPVIGQFSSIGSLGATAEGWLTGEFLKSLSSTKSSKLGKFSVIESFGSLLGSVSKCDII